MASVTPHLNLPRCTLYPHRYHNNRDLKCEPSEDTLVRNQFLCSKYVCKASFGSRISWGHDHYDCTVISSNQHHHQLRYREVCLLSSRLVVFTSYWTHWSVAPLLNTRKLRLLEIHLNFQSNSSEHGPMSTAPRHYFVGLIGLKLFENSISREN